MFMNDFLKLGSSNKVVTGNVLNVAIECKKYGIKNILDSGVKSTIVYIRITYIGLTLTNKPSHFQLNNNFENGLSDFHLLKVIEFKMGFQKPKPQIMTYCNYFDNEKF